MKKFQTPDSVMRKWALYIRLRKQCNGPQSWIMQHQIRFVSSISSDFIDLSPCTASTVPRNTSLGVTRKTPAGPGQFTRLGLIPDSSGDTSRSCSRGSSRSANCFSPGIINAVEVNSLPLARISKKATLPFDDEGFAEKVLEMEVEGAIDECWQDQRTTSFEDVREISRILEAMKVRDICCVATSQKTSSFDYIMFGTCEGQRHIHLASWAIQESDKAHRISKVKRKKADETWEVVPVGRIVVNLMSEALRSDLSLERKWTVTSNMDPLQAANAPVSEGRFGKAHGLWTLTLNLQDLEDFEIDYCKDALLQQL